MAHARGTVEIADEIDRLGAETDFHLPESLLPEILEDAALMRKAFGNPSGPP